MDIDDVAFMFLSSATEDRFGLYEAIWELNGRFPRESLGRKYDVARAALERLLRSGWIRLERGTKARGYEEFETIPESQIEAVLDNPVSWYPDYDNTKIVYVCTAEGMDHYMRSARP